MVQGVCCRSGCQDPQAWEVCSWEAQEDEDIYRGQSDPQALGKIPGFPEKSRALPKDPSGARVGTTFPWQVVHHFSSKLPHRVAQLDTNQGFPQHLLETP